MIPKFIHYCWFGHNPLPPLAVECIASWKKYLPDYEIKEWNEDNFDVNIIQYTSEAYKIGKYAFVSDYARFWILYHHGGLYFDTDVKIIKPINDIVSNGGFMGCESDCISKSSSVMVNPGLGLGCEAGDMIYGELLKRYASQSFYHADGTPNLCTIVDYTTEVLTSFGMKQQTGIQTVGTLTIYPSDYFNPVNIITKRLHVTANTRSIHYGAASWQHKGFRLRLKAFLRKLLPESILFAFNKLKHR